MGKSLEPGEPFEVWLDCHADRPKETRPVLICKTQAIRGQTKLAIAYDQYFDLKNEKSMPERYADLVAACSDIIIGWRNMNGVEFSLDAICDVFSSELALELIRKVGHNRPSHEEKKSSE